MVDLTKIIIKMSEQFNAIFKQIKKIEHHLYANVAQAGRQIVHGVSQVEKGTLLKDKLSERLLTDANEPCPMFFKKEFGLTDTE